MADRRRRLRDRIGSWFGREAPGLPFNLDSIGSPRWDERASAAVELLSKHAPPPARERPLRVADFGCGDERLRRTLESDFAGRVDYVGFDLLPETESVVPIDLRRELPRRPFDVIFCLGLLEYVDDPPTFLQRVRTQYPEALVVVSYAIYDSPRPLRRRERRARGWLTDYTRARFGRELHGCGFASLDETSVNEGRTGLWLLRSSTGGAGSTSSEI
jgi:SAM-dependent methyltransferase